MAEGQGLITQSGVGAFGAAWLSSRGTGPSRAGLEAGTIDLCAV